MSYTNGLDKPSDYFVTKLYTGNASTNNITGLDFQPNMNWIKTRTRSGYNHCLVDSVRGVTKVLRPNLSNAEDTYTDALTSFNSDGFSLGADSNGEQNKSGDSYVSWNWKETATAGFDIVSYTGNGSARTISHSLSAIPKMMMVKRRDSGGGWIIFHSSLGNTKIIELHETAASQSSSSSWNNTSPTSSVFTVGDANAVNASSGTFVAYLFSEKKGYSKIGSYTGTGSDVFIYTGFKVGWLLVKNADNTNGWLVIDTKRSPANPQGKYQYANASSAEGTVTYGEFFSNGFGWRGTGSVAVNQSGEKFIYMAFAENPFVTSTGVPATAR